MSDARWCDYADHAFKGGQENTVVITDYKAPEALIERKAALEVAAGGTKKK